MAQKLCKVADHNFSAVKVDEIKTAPILIGKQFSNKRLRVISICTKCGKLLSNEIPLTEDLTAS